MTLGEVYRQGKQLLINAGNEAPAFDADCLFQKVFGLDRQGRIMHGAQPAQPQKEQEYIKYAKERAAGRPLQYILGKWPFLGMELTVGEGVLIPREETELLVKTAVQMLDGRKSPKIIDLCSGTGAVALGLASFLPDAHISAVELYEDALSYLNRNIVETGFKNVVSCKLDILREESAATFSKPDCIVSNPPYVESGEIVSLQPEVQLEPHSALDGGDDGLVFYRAIANIWLPLLQSGGVAAVEVGERQAQATAQLFEAAGLSQIRIFRDFNGIERVVAGVKIN